MTRICNVCGKSFELGLSVSFRMPSREEADAMHSVRVGGRRRWMLFGPMEGGTVKWGCGEPCMAKLRESAAQASGR